MTKKNKTLCKWGKLEIRREFTSLRKIVKKPKYTCRNCARVARKKQWLCRPISLVKRCVI